MKKASKKKGRTTRKTSVSSSISIRSLDDDSVVSGGADDDSTMVGDYADGDEMPALAHYEGWRAKYKLPLKALEIKSFNRRDVVVELNHRAIKQTRRFIFDIDKESTEFVEFIEEHKKEELKRKARRYRHALGNIELKPKEMCTLLIEIVSGTDLPIADFNSSDPFVKCFIGGKEVHRTSHMPKT